MPDLASIDYHWNIARKQFPYIDTVHGNNRFRNTIVIILVSVPALT